MIELVHHLHTVRVIIRTNKTTHFDLLKIRAVITYKSFGTTLNHPS